MKRDSIYSHIDKVDVIGATFVAMICIFFLQSGARSFYVHYYEFQPAAAEWYAARDRHDAPAKRKAYRKERIAHCRTVDPFWFYPAWARDCSRAGHDDDDWES